MRLSPRRASSVSRWRWPQPPDLHHTCVVYGIGPQHKGDKGGHCSQSGSSPHHRPHRPAGARESQSFRPDFPSALSSPSVADTMSSSRLPEGAQCPVLNTHAVFVTTTRATDINTNAYPAPQIKPCSLPQPTNAAPCSQAQGHHPTPTPMQQPHRPFLRSQCNLGSCLSPWPWLCPRVLVR